MKMRIALAVLLTLCMIIPLALGAQEKKPVSAVLEFVDTPTSKQFRVLNAEKNPVSYREGMTLEIGWTVQTGKGDSAEVRLTHNRTIIKISQNTSFTVKDLGNTRDKPNVLAVAAGKIRVVAGKATGENATRSREAPRSAASAAPISSSM
jgi:hypothetical protein